MEKVNNNTSLDFKWLKMRGVRENNKEVQYYESFMYDGVKYMLYDCVYMYNERLQEVYIGKLTNMWERPDKTKEVKVHWFFHPEEISRWLGGTVAFENEIFFATGEGYGLANINHLEGIVDLCNVVCISKDSRNPQPSNEQLEAADFVFYRTFDVQSCTISEKMGDTVGGLEIKYVFNKEKREKLTPLLGSTSGTKEESQNIFTPRETQQLLRKSLPYKLKDELERKPQNKDIPRLLERNTNFTEIDESHDRSLKRIKSDVKCVEPGVAPGFERMTDMPSMKPMADKGRMKVGIVPAERVENRKRNKRPTGSDILSHQPSKKFKPDGKEPPEAKHVELEVVHESKRSEEMSSMKSGVDSNLKNERKLPADVNGLKSSGTCGTIRTAEEPKNSKVLAKLTSDKLNGKNLKETRDDVSFKVPDNKMGTNTNVRDVSALSKGESKSGIALDICGNNKNNNFNKEAYVVKSGESEKELSINKSLEVSALATDKDKKNAYQKSVVKLRSNADSSRRSCRWDNRLKNAYEQGAAILLHNVDPDFSSGEVEDIIWHVFREMCDAKVIQRSLASSPHYAQALILLKTKEAAQRILEKLDEECLMLSNGGQMFMPLVGTPCPPISTKGSSIFFGHLAINKARFQNKRADGAISTSHFSQPNTSEYDLAMEWFFLYFKSIKWWEKFHEHYRLELENLKNDFKKFEHEVL